MQENLIIIASNRHETVKLIQVTVTLSIEKLDIGAYIVLKKDSKTGAVSELHQFDTEIKAQRKFDRLTR